MSSKSLGFVGLAIATGAVLSFANRGAIAQVESNYTCFAIDETGRVINLEPICGEPEVAAAESTDENEDATINFLDAFADMASPESSVIGQAMGEENLVALGNSMCDFLATGANPEDLMVAFSATSLPPAFLQEVSTAAVDNLCTPAPVDQIDQ